MEYKYVIIFSSPDHSSVINRIKSMCACWWIPFGDSSECVVFIRLNEPKGCDEIRDFIRQDSIGSFCVMKIITDKNVASYGNYANEKTWSWLKSYCNNQLGEYLNANKKINIISNCEINEKPNEIGL